MSPMDAAAFLSSLDFVNLVLLFWYSVLLEAPRYMIGAIAAVIAVLSERPLQPPDTNLTVSVILAGHNLSSTGRRNSSVRRFHKLVQSLGRCSPSKRLARTTVQRCRHGGKRVDAVHAQVRALRKVLAQ